MYIHERDFKLYKDGLFKSSNLLRASEDHHEYSSFQFLAELTMTQILAVVSKTT